ncbi:MAG TPA: antibiotic biosynthesis monooxygenase [Thiothrix sp.]|nr:antibiotic biosynthesis monooxygenase [Thiothrix sp.]
MYAVIFKAEINKLDANYFDMASRMRDLAINQYGCKAFTSVTEGTQEIAISYWEEQKQITQWKQDADHLAAQALGQHTWYKAYTVQVVEILREYSKSR